jgi:hypothetical protein
MPLFVSQGFIDQVGDSNPSRMITAQVLDTFGTVAGYAIAARVGDLQHLQGGTSTAPIYRSTRTNKL